MKKLYKGRYYWHRDASRKGLHPAYIYKKFEKKNKYYVVCFTSKKGKKRIKLLENIDPNSNEPCYVLNRPLISQGKYFGDELVGFRVKNPIDKIHIRRIKSKK